MNGNDTSPDRHHFKGRFRHQNIIDSPIVNHNDNKFNYDIIDNDGGNQEATRKEEGLNVERLKEKNIVEDRRNQEERNEKNVFVNKERQGKLEENASNNKKDVGANCKEEENNNNRENWFIGPGSPSFREYCNDYDSVNRIPMGDSNDYFQSGESAKNSSDEDSTKPGNDYSKKERQKKERRERGGFRNALHRGK
ncbi:unnamed protein product [Lathyrus sativus]|nr:unnamed protein product [Lathyrus sativus]